jgi:photosystem II stability/assembly factor-like uncharacterized protein
MRHKLFLIFSTIVLMNGCVNEPDRPYENQRPKTFFWIYPDSTIREGNSKQRIHWWGEDPDGVVKGYLFASGKFLTRGTSLVKLDSLDVVRWSWTTANDTFLAFPLVVKRDTFDIAVRAVDNSFQQDLPANAVVRFKPEPYWDVNDNGSYDSGDIILASLSGAVDQKGATLAMPLLNIPPTIRFALDPNNPVVPMQPPPVTFTVATFSWIGSDEDGDQTIARYELSLNDTSFSNRFFVNKSVTLVTFVVPRTLSDTASREVEYADVYSGTFGTRIQYLGRMKGLKVDTLNTFYVRARDVAGDASPDSVRRWYVKKPRGKVLLVNDFLTNVSGHRDSVFTFYKNTLQSINELDYDTSAYVDIAFGLTASDKIVNKVGTFVPPYIDPAFIYTLRLFDVVLWYTDQNPSLTVARFPLYQYTNDPSRRGRVLYTTMFQYASDPSGALKDFAPLDSISSVNLDPSVAQILRPTFGDVSIPQGYYLIPDSSEPNHIYPMLQFTVSGPLHSVYLRPIYKRADSRYIYRIQDDTRSSIKYTYVATLNNLRSLSVVGSHLWTCGVNGTILHSTDEGVSWKRQSSPTTENLNAIQFVDEHTGWIVGDNGAYLRTTNGGTTWNLSPQSFEDLKGIFFASPTTGFITATSIRGRTTDKTSILRSSDGGITWKSIASNTTANLNAVAFADVNFGIAVGDSGVIQKTTDGGLHWDSLPRVTFRKLNAVTFFNNSSRIIIAGENGIVLRSTDGGVNWNSRSLINFELKSISFSDENTGWIAGLNGTLFSTNDGGITWTNRSVSTSLGVTQHINSVVFTDANTGYAVCTGGVIMKTDNQGTTWNFLPKGNINVGVINGNKNFVFLSLPLHRLNGNGTNVKDFLEYVLLTEFGL